MINFQNKKNSGSLEEQKLNNLLKQFENFSIGEKPIIKTKRKINHFEPKNLAIKPWKQQKLLTLKIM